MRRTGHGDALGAPAGDAPLLVAESVDKGFAADGGGRALRRVSLRVRRGEVVGLVGPDGAGKTTLLRLGAGLLRPDRGAVRILGRDAARETIAVRGRIGYMPQRFGLYEDLTVRENLELYADLQSVPRGERAARFARLLAMTGLAPFTARLAGRLSGGMKQKLGLACSLVRSPPLLLLDEPTVGVDPVSRRELWAILDELVTREGVGVLVATAYLDEAERCHRVAVLFDGEKVGEGAPAAFRDALGARVFELRPRGQREARRLQTRLAAAPEVADATIRRGRVRIVAREGGVESLRPLLGREEQAGLHPALAVFEDAFMAMAGERRRGPAPAAAGASAGAAGAREPREAGPAVSVRGLEKRFGSFVAVRGIGFEVAPGEVFGLLGPNGAGKTTTFRMLCGLAAASDGELRVAGRDLRRAAGRARSRLGYMAQHFSLYGPLSVRENLRFFGRAYGLRGRRLGARLDAVLEEFGLKEHARTPAGELPGGYKQRLAMAAALLHEPEILFLDEPTSGVDPLARREFWVRINALAASGVAVVVTTHFMEEAEYCDRMLVMSRGEPLVLGTPEEVRSLARSAECPDPSVEDAFVALAEGRVRPPPEMRSRGGVEGAP